MKCLDLCPMYGFREEFPFQVEACFSMSGDLIFIQCLSLRRDKWQTGHLTVQTVTLRTWAFTFSIQDVVSWEHDTTTHYVSFRATWTKSISKLKAMEDHPIIYQKGWRVRQKKQMKMSNVFCWLYNWACSVIAYSAQDWEEVFYITQNFSDPFSLFPAYSLAQFWFLCCETQCSV